MALVALLTFGCSLAWLCGLPFGSAFLPCSLACLLPRRFVILSVAKNPYFDFMDTSLRSVWQASCAFWAALLTFGCSACLAFGFLARLFLPCSAGSVRFLSKLCLARSARCHFKRTFKDKSPKFVILSGVRKHKAKNPRFKSAICTLNLRLNLNQPTPQTAENGYFAIAQYDKTKWQANLAFDSLFACRKRLIANSVPNLPFVCQANLKTNEIVAQKMSFAEKICKFFSSPRPK